MPSVTSSDYRIGLLSTYPPKHCGLATFAARRARTGAETVTVSTSCASTMAMTSPLWVHVVALRGERDADGACRGRGVVGM